MQQLPGEPAAPDADSAPDDARRRFPLEDVQEACLLRYFVDELSHWFDLCDQDRQFQLVVPLQARRHPHLFDAILAVAARHLSRLPHLKTPGGVVVYHGQPLPGLGEHAAVEYMLRCIPALRQFDGATTADDYRGSIMATAVILRQLEEIDHEDHHPRRVKFRKRALDVRSGQKASQMRQRSSGDSFMKPANDAGLPPSEPSEPSPQLDQSSSSPDSSASRSRRLPGSLSLEDVDGARRRIMVIGSGVVLWCYAVL